jgi:hypothetical protein
MARRWLLPLVLVVGVVAAPTGYFAYEANQLWSDLRDAADEFEVPAGFRLIGRREAGTAFCWFSCSGPGIDLVYETEEQAPEAICRALVAPIAELTGADPAHEAGFTTLCLTAPLRSVRGDASVGVSVIGAEVVTGPPECRVAAPGKGCAIIEFASGLN